MPSPLNVTLPAAESTRHARSNGISPQAWRLFPKIREIDTLLPEDPLRAERILEAHPEVSSSFWNAATQLPASKKSREGRAAGARLIDATWPGEPELLLHELRAVHRGAFAVHNLPDAFAALWSMRRHLSRTAIPLPAMVDRDSAGLPQQILS